MSGKTRKDAITGYEIADTAASASSSASSSASPSLNAFSAIMNKRKASSPCSGPSKKPHSKNPVFGRDGLGPYIDHPENFDASRVISCDENFVAIHDLYPKSSVHTLLLPRSQKHTLQHPFDAFEDAEFLASVRERATKLRDYVGKELQLKYGKFSKQDIPRQKVLNKEIELAHGEDMPVGRDWTKDVKIGIHAHPSMNHLHIHVLSIDHYSECLKHRKHYNSFATAFFVDLADFPLAKDDVRRKAEYLNRDMECWRCEKNFGNKFVKLKEHLREEFEEWKKE